MLTFYVFSAGVVVALLVCLPDYPFFNTHPLPWQQPVKPAEVESEEVTGEVTAAEVVSAGGEEEEAEAEEQEEKVIVVKKKKKGSKKPAASSDRKQ